MLWNIKITLRCIDTLSMGATVVVIFASLLYGGQILKKIICCFKSTCTPHFVRLFVYRDAARIAELFPFVKIMEKVGDVPLHFVGDSNVTPQTIQTAMPFL